MNFGKLLSSLARHVLIPAVAAIAKNPKAPLTLDAAKDALVEAGKEEGLRQVTKRL
jgi:seryl-tRNA(Sec) selenium transferase